MNWAEGTFILLAVLVVVLASLLGFLIKSNMAMNEVFELLNIMDERKQDIDAQLAELTREDEWGG